MTNKKDSGRPALGNILLWTTVVFLTVVLSAGLSYKLSIARHIPQVERAVIKTDPERENSPGEFVEEKPLYEEESSSSQPRVAIIIDDLGWNPRLADELMEIEAPLSLSILPNQRFSRQIAEKAVLRGKDILLHIPMEPHEKVAPGKGLDPLLDEMGPERIVKLSEGYIDSLPYLQGVNNHMGSSFTEKEPAMAAFLSVLEKKNLFFIDSRTSARSVGYRLAKKMGVPTAQRQVFLDHEDNPEAIGRRIEQLEKIALKVGKAIAIGHPNRNTIDALKEMVADFEEKGIAIVSISQLVE